MMTQTQDDYLGIDPREFTIEHYGHGRYYRTHECPTCEKSSLCRVEGCKQRFAIECLPCATRELIEDTERFAKEAREFLATDIPLQIDTQTLIWWRALRAEIDGKLKGLAERSSELQKRMDSEVKA